MTVGRVNQVYFIDNRKGNFIFEGRKYDVQLVDLPTVIESQKTLDKKQFYKVADISQVKMNLFICNIQLAKISHR